MRRAGLVLFALSLAASSALAIGPELSPFEADPDYRQAQDRLEVRDWPGAIAAFSRLLAQNPRSAEVWTWLGFAHRRAGDLDSAAKYYEEALRIDPDYLPAIEYQGHWHLARGDVASAHANLARLTALCGDCTERAQLAAALAAH